MQTIQLYAYDSNGVRWELDLYEEDPIRITLSSEDIIDIPRIDASFSRQFRIPATNTNSKFFKYWYISGIVDFDVTKKVVSEIYVNGVFWKAGQLRMEAVYDNPEIGVIDFEVVFLGETKDFATQVGEGFMNELNTHEANHELLIGDLLDTWREFGDPDLFLDGKVRYILAQRGNNWNSAGAPIEPSAIDVAYENWNDGGPDANEQGGTFVNPSHPLPINMMTPIIQVKYLIDKMFEMTSYTYSSDSIFNDDWFKYLYTDGIDDASPWIPRNEGLFEANTTTSTPIGGEEVVIFDNELNDPTNSYNNLTGIYTVPNNGTFALQSTVECADNYFSYPYGGFEVKLYVNGVVQDSASQSATGLGPFTPSISVSYTYSATAGDQIWITVEPIGASENPGYLAGSTFECVSATNNIIVSGLLKSDVKIIDFFKSILTKFRLVMVPNKENPYEFIIKNWSDYIATGDNFDWTYKLDTSKDVILKPIFYSQSAIVNFTDQEDSDLMNIMHQTNYNYVYGRRLFDSQNDLIKDVREVTTIFAPTPVDQIHGAVDTSNFIVPYLCSWPNGETVTHGNHTHPKLEPMRPKPRLLWWNGAVLTSPLTTWYYTDYNGFNPSGTPGVTINSTTSYPRASYLSEIPTTVNAVNLSWKKEFAYFEDGNSTISGFFGSDLYELYWSDYINDLYSSEARIMTAYFKLSAEDLRNLTFDDVIFIKDAYWRVQKVYDAPLGEIETIKVDLIRLVNYNPTIINQPAESEELFGDATGEYSESIGTWNSLPNE